MAAPRAGGGRPAAAGAANFQRRTWDRDEFEKRGRERLEKDLSGEALLEAAAGPAAAFRAAPPGLKGPEGSERAYTQSREYDLQLDAKLGKRRLVTETTPQNQVGGYFCETCACTLRDSTAYLDHITGRNPQKRLGFSMRVERSTVEQVKARLDAAKSAGAAAAGGAPVGFVVVLPTLEVAAAAAAAGERAARSA
jgi:U4/U6.U5 tri-snRNP component SNU23